MSHISDGICDKVSTKKSFASTEEASNKSKSIKDIIDELANKSWIEMEDLENDSTIESVNRMDISDQKRPEIKLEPSVDADGVDKSPPVKLESKFDPDCSDREIAVEFLDVSNEAKYERLIKDEKIKTPFKRRLSGNSNESRSSSPLSVQSTEEAQRAAAAAKNKNMPKKTRYDPTSYHRRDSTGSGESGGSKMSLELETCEEVLSRRQKQIDYGKNTIGYDNYVEQVPKRDRTKDHPWTPPKRTKYSRRAWDGLVRVWRKKLHCWDPEGAKEEAPEGDDSDTEETAEEIKTETKSASP